MPSSLVARSSVRKHEQPARQWTRTIVLMARAIAVCRKCKNHDCLIDVLEAHGDVSIRRVKCQKICHGPVVGLPVGGRMEWFEKVSSLKELAALVRLTKKSHAEAIPKALRKRRVKSYAGRQPRE